VLTVISFDGKNCKIRYSSEAEGGGSVYVCTVHREIGKFESFTQIKQHCKLTSQGNLMSQTYTYYYSLPFGINITSPTPFLDVAIVGLIIMVASIFIVIHLRRKKIKKVKSPKNI